MKKIKLCIVTEFEQENFFQWKIALSYYHELEVTSVVMSENIMMAKSLDDKHWDAIREADVVFVYCVRHDLSWEWYKLPLLVKKIMNPKAKMVCQFDSEFLWLWHPNHHFWKKEVVWAKNKTPKQFFEETKVMEVADVYIVLANSLLKEYTSKPIYYLPLPQLVRYYSLLKAIPSKKDLKNKSKRVIVLRHSVKSASIKKTLAEVVIPSGVPVTVFTTAHTNFEEKLKMLKGLPQPKKSVVYGNVPRDVYMEFLERGYAAIDDNEGYYGWSRFAMECALTHIPCVGSTRAVKEFFPELFTERENYEKQSELLKRLYDDENFWLKMAKAGKRRVLKKMDADYLVKKLIKIITSVMEKESATKLKEEAVKSKSSEWKRYKEYEKFVERWKSRHKTIPLRPSKGASTMDVIHKQIITQEQWDVYYGKWRKFIKKYKPKKPKMSKIVCDVDEKTEVVEVKPITISGTNGARLSDEGELLRPLLAIMSPRDIPWIKEKYDKIDYVDVLWIKHYPTNETVEIAKRYFLDRAYTHLILTADDTAPEYDGIAKLMADVAKYDLPVVTGCCSSDAVTGSMHLNLTFTPVVTKHPSKLSHDIYENLQEQFRQLNGIVKVWFQGNACSVMRRDVVEKAFGWTWQGRFGADIRFSWECAQRKIPQYADLRVWMDHSKYPRYGMFKLSLQSGNTRADGKAIGKLIFKRASKSIPIEEPAEMIEKIPYKLRKLMRFFYSERPKRKFLKICLVTEFDQGDFPWRKALLTYQNGKYDGPYRERTRKVGAFKRKFPMQVSSVVMNPFTLSMYGSNHPYWNPIRKAHVVFVYCAHRNLRRDSLSWYKLPLLVKEKMKKKAKLICQFAHEFLWLWHPDHVYQSASISWSKEKTAEEFFEETDVLKVADGYFTVIDNPPWGAFCKKPIFYMPLPQRNQYVMRRRHRYITKAILLPTMPKRIALIYHSVKSASIKHTVRNLIKKTGLPTVVFLTTESPMSQRDKKNFITKNGLPRGKTSIRENLCRTAFINEINKCWIAIDDNKGYYGWSKFAYECALASVPCIGSTRAVKQLFPQLYTQHKDYAKQKELIDQLKDEDFYLGMIAAGSRRSRYQLGNTRMAVDFITCARFDLNCPISTLSKSQMKRREEESFINFLMGMRNFSSIPSRPRETQRIFDQNLKRIIGRDEWDEKYGEWSKFIHNQYMYRTCCREAKRRLSEGKA